jgi:hypothetical protein
VPAPESAIPLDPELPELPLEPELPLDPELPELPLDPELVEVPLEPELLLNPESLELPLEPELPPEPEGDPLLPGSDMLASGEKPVLSPVEPQAQTVTVADATAKRLRARMVDPSFPSSSTWPLPAG